MVSLIVIWKKSWRSVALKWIMPHLTAGLSTIRPSSQQKPKNVNGPLHRLGEWMKPTLKSKAQWVYLYRAVDKFGATIDFMVSGHRDEAAATALFKQAIDANGFPSKVVMDKSGANYAGIENINMLLMLAGLICFIEICQVKYLNNLIEQDHRFIKKITKPMMGFKAFHSAQATIDGIETAHMIRKEQLSEENIPAYKQFMALAG